MKFNSNLGAFMREFDKRMKAAGEVIGGMLESNAKDMAPADTGLLRNSITHGMAGGKIAISSYTDDSGSQTGEYPVQDIPEAAGGAKYQVVVGTNVKYAPYQELGTYKMEANPFLRPAFEGHAEEYKAAIEDILKG